MGVYIGKRMLLGLLTMLGATIVAFILGILSPSDPAMVALSLDGNSVPTAMELEEKRRSLGLDAPYTVQYVRWVYGVMVGDWGTSYITGDPLFPRLWEASKVTMTLTLLGLLNIIVGGLLGGTILGATRNRFRKKVAFFLTVFGSSVPSFWLAIILMHILSEQWRIFPTNGYDSLWHLVLPAFVLSVSGTSLLMRIHATGVERVQKEGYFLTARAKGLPHWYILYKHVLRNASLSSLTVIGNYIVGMIGGAIIVEVIFSLPGLGSLMLEGIRARDYPIVQGYVLLVGAMTAFINISIDICYTWLQPKIR